MDSYKGAKKTIIRLLSEDGAKRPSPAPHIPAVRKLVIRLLPPLNDRLRTEMRYRGDLSKMIAEAINSVDLQKVRIVDLSWDTRLEAATMISLPQKMHAALKALSKARATPMNVLVNTAVAHWLARKGIIGLA
ncbi:MAG TPA: hypothetical protein VEF34_04290 [Syntrophobacteraceae bacterium]|nr:hypothetical protein [Syntrophobacteraceae bacterium]